MKVDWCVLKCILCAMNNPFKAKEYGNGLTLAQLWKAKKASEKLARSDSKRTNVNRKKAA